MVSVISMRATLKAMEVGEVVRIPLGTRGYNSVRNCASLLAGELGRKYSVNIDRQSAESKVTRVL